MEEVNRREVYRYLGYRGSTPDAEVAKAVEDCLEELRRTVTPRYVFRRYEIQRASEDVKLLQTAGFSKTEESLQSAVCSKTEESSQSAEFSKTAGSPISGEPLRTAESLKTPNSTRGRTQPPLLQIAGMKIRSRNLAVNLRGCDSVYLMAATLGIGPDRLIARASVNRMSRAVIFQAAAAAMIESWCDEVNSKIIHEASKEGLYCRPRFSPGYGDFPLEFQRDFAQILCLQKEIGVSLTASMLMMPSKSVTAIIGLSRENEKCSLHGCEECSKAAVCAFSRLPDKG